MSDEFECPERDEPEGGDDEAPLNPNVNDLRMDETP